MKLRPGLLGIPRGRTGHITARSTYDRAGRATSVYADPRTGRPATGGSPQIQEKLAAINSLLQGCETTRFWQHWPRRRGQATPTGDIIRALWRAIPLDLGAVADQAEPLGCGPPWGWRTFVFYSAAARIQAQFKAIPPPPAFLGAAVYSLAWPRDLSIPAHRFAIDSNRYAGTTAITAYFDGVPLDTNWDAIAYWRGVGAYDGYVGWLGSKPTTYY